jgi:hypothetical protein
MHERTHRRRTWSVRAARGLPLVALFAVTAVMTTAAAGGLSGRPLQHTSTAKAATFAVRTVRLLAENRYAEAWASLHPAHQRIVGSRAAYVRCERTTLIPGTSISLNVLATRSETLTISGIGRARTQAVTLSILIAGPAEPEGVPIEHTVHVLLVKGRWRWVLPEERYALYRDYDCGRRRHP